MSDFLAELDALAGALSREALSAWDESREATSEAESEREQSAAEALDDAVARLRETLARIRAEWGVESDTALMALPVGVVVRSAFGTIACRADDEHGVVFGDERPFSWMVLGLPVTVLWRPEWGEGR